MGATLGAAVGSFQRLRVSGAPEPARTADRAELILLGGVLERGVVALGRRRVAAEEVDLDLADEPAAELGVADTRALIRRRRLVALDRGRDVVGNDPRGSLGEDPRLGNRPRAATETSPSAYTPGNRVLRLDWSTGTQLLTTRPESASTAGARWIGMPMNRS
jgi:hypothetical protein